MIYDHPLVKDLYGHSPTFTQNIMFTAYGFLKWYERNGRVFRDYSRELGKTQWESSGLLEELQNTMLKVLMKHAYANVPYYRRVFRERNLKPSDIKTKEDLKKLPYLTRHDVKENFSKLRAVNIPSRKYLTAHTGGTTGDPLMFLLDKRRLVFTRALQFRHWRSLGYTFRSKLAFMRAVSLMSADSSGAPFWRHDWFQNTLFLSAYHMSQANLPDYGKKLVSWKPDFLFTYPSSACVLARFLLEEGLDVSLKAVFTGSETLLPSQRELIERAFGCRVFDEYGHAERAIRAGECERGGYHVDAEYGIFQIQKKGVDSGPGETGEVIATSLTNVSMPLIRYRTGDLASPSEETCPCGRGLPQLESLEGKSGDCIVTGDGRVISGILVSPVMGGYSGVIREWQVVQPDERRLIVKIVPEDEFNAREGEGIIARLKGLLGHDMEVTIQVLDEIDRSKSGKFRCVISDAGAMRGGGL